MLNNLDFYNSIAFKGNSNKPKSTSNPVQSDRKGLFDTEQNKKAQTMNLAAIYDIKHHISETRPKVKSKEDRDIVYSNTPEMSKRWTTWINPKTLKAYTVINKKNNPDGTRTLRILNEEGNLIKEKDIKPKKIVILDSKQCERLIFRGKRISHYDLVKLFIERYNPAVDIEFLNCGNLKGEGAELNYSIVKEQLENISKRIADGEKIDYINCSFGYDCSYSPDDPVDRKAFNKIFSDTIEDAKQDPKIAEVISAIEKMQDLISKGVKVVYGAGNKGKNSFGMECVMCSGAEIVGSFDENGKVSDFSASRHYATGYEQSEHIITAKKDGLNITGKPGVDISYKGTTIENYTNKKVKDCLIGIDKAQELFKNHKEDELKGKVIQATNADGSIEEGVYIAPVGVPYAKFKASDDGYLIPITNFSTNKIFGTSFSAPIRTAKLALNETMKEIQLENT